ncbi:MAG: hypothetical protein MJ025_05645 [Victivallaceae bacterium]|nr:hypothetical protein [Victivallaceae bacterium]
MRGKIALMAATAALLAACGCSNYRLRSGCYHGSGLYDNSFACAYDDMLFIRVEMPDDLKHSGSTWDWGGKYKIEKEGNDREIVLDMENDDMARRWNFYFKLKQDGDDIAITDVTRNKVFVLRHESVYNQHRSVEFR